MRSIKSWVQAWQGRRPHAFLLLWGVLELLLLCLGALRGSGILWGLGGAFWGLVLFCLWLVTNPGKKGQWSPLHAGVAEQPKPWERVFLILLVAVLILSCTLPMGISPVWNGEEPEHRNQYEYMTEALLDGRLWMDYYVDPMLLEMENPYDYEAREELEVICLWDHAFYNGRYYMYFGVVPIFLTFLPYRLLTGHALTTYKATQFFTAWIIVGIFTLLHLLRKKFFPKMPFGMYAVLASAVSVMSVWYGVGSPALYCTAITAAICMEVWSLFFFAKAVWDTQGLNRQLLLAFFGAGFGALAFGCRPTVALANLVVIPILAAFLKKNRLTWKLVGKMALAASPYVVVAILLMGYNYARFDNPFEFGQTYQLTNSDQSQYGDITKIFSIPKVMNGVMENFLLFEPVENIFPYIGFSGALVNFPILLLSFGVAFAPVRERLRERGIGSLVTALFLTPVAITVADVLWAPFMMERYRMDIYFLLGILCFVVLGVWFETLQTEEQRRKFCSRISGAAVLTVFACFMLYLVPNDENPTAYYPQILEMFRDILSFGLAK